MKIIFPEVIASGARGRNLNVHQSGIECLIDKNDNIRVTPLTSRGTPASGCYITLHPGALTEVAAHLAGVDAHLMTLFIAMTEEKEVHVIGLHVVKVKIEKVGIDRSVVTDGKNTYTVDTKNILVL